MVCPSRNIFQFTLGNSSFLRIDKADFDDVLSTCYKMEWEQRFIALRSQPLLKKWTFSELEECNYTSRMMEWPKHTVRPCFSFFFLLLLLLLFLFCLFCFVFAGSSGNVDGDANLIIHKPFSPF